MIRPSKESFRIQAIAYAQVHIFPTKKELFEIFVERLVR